MATSSITAQLLESLTLGRVIAAITIFLVMSFVVDFAQKPRYPKSLPRVGYGYGIVGTVKNWAGYMTHYTEWVDEGYEKVSTTSQSHVSCQAARLTTPQILL